MSPWWLLLIVPASVSLGVLVAGWCWSAAGEDGSR